MGKAGRIACIAVPMVLTVISLVLLIVVGIGGWNKNDSNLSSLYFFKADTTGFKTNITNSGLLAADLPGNIDDKLRTFLNQLTSSSSNQNLSDVYEIYLWNYCEGSKSNGTSGDVKLTHCSPRQARFWFNPVEVWGLNNTGIEDLIPSELEKGLNIYKAVANWMFVAYAIAFFATIANIIVGLLAICSRWGSCVTTIVSAAAPARAIASLAPTAATTQPCLMVRAVVTNHLVVTAIRTSRRRMWRWVTMAQARTRGARRLMSRLGIIRGREDGLCLQRYPNRSLWG